MHTHQVIYRHYSVPHRFLNILKIRNLKEIPKITVSKLSKYSSFTNSCSTMLCLYKHVLSIEQGMNSALQEVQN